LVVTRDRNLRVVAALAVAAAGLALLFFLRGRPGGDSRQGASSLAWFDRGGRRSEVLGTTADYLLPRLSPDGRRLAMDMVDGVSHRRDIWLCDLDKRAWTRFTTDPSSASTPVWSPDGRFLVFSSTRAGRAIGLYSRTADATGKDELLYESESMNQPTDCSPDGRYIAFASRERESETGWDIWILELSGRKAAPFLETKAEERGAVFSPDGASIAYSSSESGTDEVYVRPFRRPGEARKISTGGGSSPRWRRDGKEIFYVAPGNQMMSVLLSENAAPRRLFSAKMAAPQFFDVSPDGQRFLISLSD
jgi:Tol biopolymer transport system component